MKKIIVLLSLGLFCLQAQADSPLTSTDFYRVYEEYDIVEEAIDAKGKITNDLMLYLSDAAYPVDVKMAVINALGWNFNGQNNYQRYLRFVEMRAGITHKEKGFYKEIDSDEILSLAYLKAMDNYFDVAEAKKLSSIAVASSRRATQSYTFRLIDALIGAQQAMEGNWCTVYQIANSVKLNPSLRWDFPTEADDIVFDYMGLYKKDCQ